MLASHISSFVGLVTATVRPNERVSQPSLPYRISDMKKVMLALVLSCFAAVAPLSMAAAQSAPHADIAELDGFPDWASETFSDASDKSSE